MDAIQIRDLELWAHVGVLEQERRDGQWFRLDIQFQLDLLSELSRKTQLKSCVYLCSAQFLKSKLDF